MVARVWTLPPSAFEVAKVSAWWYGAPLFDLMQLRRGETVDVRAIWLLRKAMEPACDRRGVIVNRDDQRVLEVGTLRDDQRVLEVGTLKVTYQWYEQQTVAKELYWMERDGWIVGEGGTFRVTPLGETLGIPNE